MCFLGIGLLRYFSLSHVVQHRDPGDLSPGLAAQILEAWVSQMAPFPLLQGGRGPGGSALWKMLGSRRAQFQRGSTC
jgi:hypothetical protein